MPPFERWWLQVRAWLSKKLSFQTSIQLKPQLLVRPAVGLFYGHWPLKETITCTIKITKSLCSSRERSVRGRKEVEKQLYNIKGSEEREGRGTPGAEISLQSVKTTMKQVVPLQPMQRTMGEKNSSCSPQKGPVLEQLLKDCNKERDVGAGDKCEEEEEAERSCCGLITTQCYP